VPVNFDHIARFYSLAEKIFFGKHLNFARTYFAQYTKLPQTVLLVGEGRGHFLNFLLNQNQFCKITIVDSSSKMIKLMESKLEPNNLNRVHFYNDSLEYFTSNIKYDLVCTFFFWDCFSRVELDHLVPKFLKFLKVDGIWINADFIDGINNLSFSNILNFFKLRILFLFFRVSTGINAKKVEPLEVYLEKNLIKLIEFHKNSDNHIKTEVFQKLAKL